MMCDYPRNTPLSAYRKGCRCDRCRTAKRASENPRPRFRCVLCGNHSWKPEARCNRCYRASPIERVMQRIVIDENGCWVYQGKQNGDGYGVISPIGGGPNTTAHRVTYEHFVGPIEDGNVVDHLCMNRHCVNPDHLESVSQSVNMKRAWVFKKTGLTPLEIRRRRQRTVWIREAL